MTIPEFLTRLRALDDGWYLAHAGQIRRDRPACCWQCPLSALVGRSAASWFEAAKELGVSKNRALVVIHAADNAPRCSKPLRRQLLAATVGRKRRRQNNGLIR